MSSCADVSASGPLLFSESAESAFHTTGCPGQLGSFLKVISELAYIAFCASFRTCLLLLLTGHQNASSH